MRKVVMLIIVVIVEIGRSVENRWVILVLVSMVNSRVGDSMKNVS